MKKSNRETRIGGCLFLCFIPILLILGAVLLEKNHRIVSLSLLSHSTLQKGDEQLGYEYQWTPDGKILTFLPAAINNSKFAQVSILDPKTGIAGNGAAFDARKEMPCGALDSGIVSPDGKWTIWTGTNSFILVEMHGNKAIVVHRGMPLNTSISVLNSSAWLHDSRSWVELIEKRNKTENNREVQLLAHNLNGKVTRNITISSAKSPYAELLGVNAQNQAIIHIGATTGKLIVNESYIAVDLDGNPNPNHDLGFRSGELRKYGGLDGPYLSPRGDRFLWLAKPSTNIGKLLMGRLNRTPFTQQNLLLLSRTDGSDIRVIGGEDMGEDDVLDALRWLPDGKNVSFRINTAMHSNHSHRSLYVVTTE